jgi:hypothetical protein
MPTYKLGFKARMFYGAPGALVTCTSGNVLTTVTNATLNLTRAEADVTCRSSNGWKLTQGTLADASIEFEMLGGGVGFDDVRDAYLARSTIALAIMDSGANGAQGLDADFVIVGFSQDQQLTEAQKFKVTAKVSSAGRNPTWRTFSADVTGAV